MSVYNRDLTQEACSDLFGYTTSSAVHTPWLARTRPLTYSTDDVRVNEYISCLSQFQDSFRISEDVFSRMRDLVICGDPLVTDAVDKFIKGDIRPLDGPSGSIILNCRPTVIRLFVSEVRLLLS